MDNLALQGRRSASFYIQRSIGAILLVALAATFLYSAYSKIYSENAFDNFQWTFLDLGISSVIAAGVIARLMIGLELLLALLLLGHVFLKSFTYKAVIAILSIFIIYLLVVIMKQGNSGNCGCFGDKLAMKPLTAIWKNVAMIAVTVLLMFIYPVKPYKMQEYVFLFFCFAAFSTPFLLRNLNLGTNPDRFTESISLDPLYAYTPAPDVDLRKGKHIVAFMSLTCPHCKKAAYLLQIIHHEHPEIPMYIILDGHPSLLKSFFDETHAEHVPYILYRHTADFEKMAGPGVPSIYWVNNGVVEYKSKYAYYQLDPKFMLQWINAPALPAPAVK